MECVDIGMRRQPIVKRDLGEWTRGYDRRDIRTGSDDLGVISLEARRTVCKVRLRVGVEKSCRREQHDDAGELVHPSGAGRSSPRKQIAAILAQAQIRIDGVREAISERSQWRRQHCAE